MSSVLFLFKRVHYLIVCVVVSAVKLYLLVHRTAIVIDKDLFEKRNLIQAKTVVKNEETGIVNREVEVIYVGI